MSWSASTPEPVAKENINEAVLLAPVYSDVPEVEGPQRDQYQMALEAARMLAEAVGRPEDDVIVVFSGHANPEHAPREGWSHEQVAISVSARPKAQPPEGAVGAS